MSANMNRRNFLKAAGAASLALTVPVNLFSANKKKDENWLSELHYHKIAGFEYSSMKMNYPRLVGKNSRKDIHGRGPSPQVVIIKTDQGAEGFGAIRGDLNEIKKISEQFVGKRMTDVIDPGYGVLTDRAFHFDLALHDLCGQVLQKPCYEIFGRKEPFITKVYSGMIYFDDLEPGEGLTPMEQIAKNVEYDYQFGYRQFKVKIGRGAKWMESEAGLQRDVEVTRYIHENYPDCEILVDANDGYTCDDFIRYLEHIKDIPLFWIEEPFTENEADLIKLRKWLNDNGHNKTLLADGEFMPDFDFILEMGRKKILDVNILDICDFGFSRWRRYMPLMKEFEMQGSPHAWGSFNKSLYAAHFAGG